MTTTEHRIVAGPRDCLSCICGFLQVGAHAHDTEKEALTRHLLDVGREAAKGELVTLDDPRVKEGARLRLEWPDKDSDEWEAVEGRARDLHPFPNSDRGPELTVASRSVTTARRFVTTARRIYLLAEEPDPDAGVVEAIRAASAAIVSANEMGGWRPDPLPGLPEAADLLVALRAAGWDIVHKDGAR